MGKVTATIKMAFGVKGRGRNLLKAKKMLHEAKKQKLYTKLKRLYADAKKNIRDLQRHNLGDSPAIQKLEENGKIKFSVKGKTYNELQSDYFRLKRFAESETSTVKGATNVLENIARNTGIQYNNLDDLITQSKVFFDIASKVEQILDPKASWLLQWAIKRFGQLLIIWLKRKMVNLRDIHNIEEAAKTVYDSLINEYLQEEVEESILSEFFD